jgi:hypothetical protein
MSTVCRTSAMSSIAKPLMQYSIQLICPGITVTSICGVALGHHLITILSRSSRSQSSASCFFQSVEAGWCSEMSETVSDKDAM